MIHSKILAIIVIVGYNFTLIHAVTVTWTNGSGDGNWGTPTNWDSGAVPGATDDVVFDDSSDDNCLLNVDNQVIKSLSLVAAYNGTLDLRER